MDKFYCRTGGMRVVLNAEGPAEAAEAAMRKMLDALRGDDGPGLGVLMFVGRTGYDDENPLLAPTIPLAKSVGSVLCRTPDEVADMFDIDLKALPPEARRWLLGD